jgi:hypothetical protein
MSVADFITDKRQIYRKLSKIERDKEKIRDQVAQKKAQSQQ